MSSDCLPAQQPNAILRTGKGSPLSPCGVAELSSLISSKRRPCSIGLFAVAIFFVASGCACVSGPPSGTSTRGPYLSPNYASVDFGNVVVRTNSSVALMITNTSNTEAVVSERMNSGEVFGLDNGVTNFTLTRNQTAAVVVNFEPIDEGPATDTVWFQSNVSSTPLAITLTGTGVRPRGQFVTLAWNPSISLVSGYLIYRSTELGGPYMRLTDSPIQATSYSDVTVQPPQTYFYVVTSVSAQGFESSFSNEVSVKVPSP